MEFAGSLGDLGTLLPLAVGMIMINGLNPQGIFLSVGLFYLASGYYFRLPVPVQPMKVVGAYAIATGLTAQQISASGAWLALIMLIAGITGLIDLIGRYTPKAVIRGVDDTWEISLLKFNMDMIEQSQGINVFDFKRKGLL